MGEEGRAPRSALAGLFTVAVFASACLVFLVEPMVARMVLPRMGGSSSVWNTSLAFFQAALLVGYAYAHLIQRLRPLKAQFAVHLALMALAGLTLPLRISDLFGPPALDQPALWLLGVLTLSVGAPFAILSATAPLLQAWYARLTRGQAGARDPYVLYAASNLGSLLALIAYPVLFEPVMTLHAQTISWSLGYGLFALLVAGLALAVRHRPDFGGASRPSSAPPVAWGPRLVWIGLSAATSSLLLGVTAHITQDVASAPFLWVAPLALYLLSYVIAFQAHPLIGARLALILQALFVPFAAVLYSAVQAPWLVEFAANLGAFFFTALVCHHALSARKPAPERLTDFYLAMSLGGVIGGAFNAFAAPLLFNAVWEYPAVLGLACLARPWRLSRIGYWEAGLAASAALSIGLLLVPGVVGVNLIMLLLCLTAVAAVLLSRRGLIFALVVTALGLASYDQLFKGPRETYRSFFGVVQLVLAPSPVWGAVKLMINGSTLHGAEPISLSQRCIPTTYYGNGTPIGQVLLTDQRLRPSLQIGAVGLGAGTVAAYTRPTDSLRFFEIDPLMVRLAFDRRKLHFVNGCAKGAVSVTLGDARLSLNKVPDAAYDILLVDAFSSDSVPTHLLTVEAVRTYLRVIKPDGVVILHLSNRNLELEGPAAASVRGAGGVALVQDYMSPAPSPYVESASQVIIAGRNATALLPYKASGAWATPTLKARAWTDDYVNVFGALMARMQHPYWGQ
jgi:spermidine synthase